MVCPPSAASELLKRFSVPILGVNRIIGSHYLLAIPGDRTRAVTVPVHGNRDLKPGTLRSIIRQTGMTVEEFDELL